MRYVVFTDIHANLEALEAVLSKIDELAKERPIDQVWFLGDLVGYGPNPNECIAKLRERTDVIIAGNHDWAAVGKIDLEDFSAAARISAEWTAEQLTEEHRTFLQNLPERLEINECTLVHGSPYGPLWEYLTSEVLAERSFQHFSTRYCFVGHTHVPVIFQQPDVIANAPTLPLIDVEHNGLSHPYADGEEDYSDEDNDETAELAIITPPITSTIAAGGHAESAYADPETGQPVNEAEASSMIEAKLKTTADEAAVTEDSAAEDAETAAEVKNSPAASVVSTDEEQATDLSQSEEAEDVSVHGEVSEHDETQLLVTPEPHATEDTQEESGSSAAQQSESAEETPQTTILNAEERLSSEIEELLTLLGLSESMIQVTNEMITPPLGHWEAPEGQRAIINPGGVGQPRDGDPRAAFMIYDTEEGFEFYRIPYALEKTQEKIIKAGLPQYLAVRLTYGR